MINNTPKTLLNTAKIAKKISMHKNDVRPHAGTSPRSRPFVVFVYKAKEAWSGITAINAPTCNEMLPF